MGQDGGHAMATRRVQADYILQPVFTVQRIVGVYYDIRASCKFNLPLILSPNVGFDRSRTFRRRLDFSRASLMRGLCQPNNTERLTVQHLDTMRRIRYPASQLPALIKA
ncbi:hypothetical protein PILCRDRAFT_491910 [Piloderma croceum F 1598]|uniref:Uncharacterized protein n=1 Tax=Piloderma croceum (strain F 1598) TaxID=765440 RepID=A0A0C3BWU9_PILCF|nr:hypothetical protein PILCRDRAFT_491910 [Piloderma croceum F 1598]